MPWNLPRHVLLALRERMVTAANTLTQQEMEIAKRICQCSNCGNVWLRQRRKAPLRCPACHVWRYDTPTLDSLLAHPEPTLPTTTTQEAP